MDDQINLDVHAINDLQKKNFPPTDDLPKYNYTADKDGNYSEFCFIWEVLFQLSVNSKWLGGGALMEAVILK